MLIFLFIISIFNLIRLQRYAFKNSNKISLDSVKVKLTGDWEDNSSDDLTVEYITNVTYKLGDSSIDFKLKFEGDNIKYKANNPDDRWFNNIDLKNIDVDYCDINGKKIKFDAFINAPDNIKYLFVKKYVGDLFK